ncbi:GntR family transcriptional regulator [Trinickia mobilis]|uniref:GntR family transcriptional regulator n=1 Tax=Trinickia mobilis TaxID=2816356 RepID=UPI001A8D6E19|nr:GntR family transcriptional regulator [Trinickia mobilis]
MKTVVHETLGTKVYQQLREAIMSGRFPPGQPLSLRGVAEAVGSSTMPVRGALTRLQAEGALVDGPGRALMVPPITVEMLEELRDVRIALEGCVAERAASRMTDEHLNAIQQIYDEMDAHVNAGDAAAYLRTNFAFHTAIYAQGASEVTLAIIQNLWMRIGPFLNMVAPDVRHMRRSMTAHKMIVDALWNRDGPGAHAGIAKDIGDAAQDLKGRLSVESAAMPKRASG